MRITKKSSSFEPCPEYSGQAVCVDVTPTKAVETAFGRKEVFRLVFEIKTLRSDGSPFCVWSRPFTPSLHEKAALAQFLRKWYGRSLTASEESDFDTETLVGKTAELTIVHEQGRGGETYANIALIRPDKTGAPMDASGKYVRVRDREAKGGGDAEYRRTDGNDSSETSDWRRLKVHVGKHKSLDLGDLDRPSVEALIEHWLPKAKANPKPLADDRRLIAALEQAAAELSAGDDDNLPF